MQHLLLYQSPFLLLISTFPSSYRYNSLYPLGSIAINILVLPPNNFTITLPPPTPTPTAFRLPYANTILPHQPVPDPSRRNQPLSSPFMDSFTRAYMSATMPEKSCLESIGSVAGNFAGKREATNDFLRFPLGSSHVRISSPFPLRPSPSPSLFTRQNLPPLFSNEREAKDSPA